MKKTGIVLLFCWMIACQSENPEKIAIDYYLKVNEVVKGDTLSMNFIRDHLSEAVSRKAKQIPFLLQYSFLETTHTGKLKDIKVLQKQAINQDSLVLSLQLTYEDKSSKTIRQSMVLEKGIWKLGISK